LPISTKFVQAAINNPEFIKPNNPERSLAKKNRNLDLFNNIYSAVIDKSSRSTSEKLQLSGKSQGTVRKFYDDDVVRAIGEEFNDRLRAMILVGDMIRFLRLSFTRKELSPEEFVEKGLNMITSKSRIFRQDIAELTSIDFNHLNNTLPFMNGGPAGENWNKSANGFYDWIDSKSCESILGIELGFKADSYGLEVSNRLVEKKKKNPGMCINLLIDGFVSVLMQKPPSSLTDFEHNTISMIYQMRKAGIDVYVNDSWNPLSTDFLAANHIKLWIFDGEIAFYGGIGIESQFRNTLYDEMDLVQGPFVATLTTMALLLITNQKKHDDIDDEQKRNEEQQLPIYNMDRELLKRLFIKESSRAGNVSMRISMDVPGYIQDAQHDYVSLLTRRDVDEIYIMAPYFSDHKVAKALVVAADRLFMRYYRDIEDTKLNRIKSKAFDLLKVVNKPSHYAIQRKRPIGKEVTASDDIYNSRDNKKRIHVIFPKKQENHIIEEVSRYYAYYLRNNPIVETRQFYAEVGSEKYEMLHAKQMIVVLRNPNTNWTKYVKFGGSYNPAGRAQNMWEINAISFNGAWHQSDESAFTTKEKNPIKEYLENVMKIIVEKYSQPFPWGQSDFKLSFQDKISMAIARSLWF
jgi:phosphatidylserine/phosphatidylglycerophosphate/cardiolipin synthase-like enzyme